MTTLTNIFLTARQQGKSSYPNWLLDILEEYDFHQGKPFVQTYRKGWESQRQYDLENERKAPEKTAARPEVSTLPSKRWVRPRTFTGPVEDQLAESKAREDWLALHKAKYQICHVTLNGKPDFVWLFKKPQLALLFKLTWG